MYLEYRSSAASQVIWKKNTLTLKKGMAQSFRTKNKEPRVMVDTFSTLYLTGNLTLRIDLLDFTKINLKYIYFIYLNV